MVLFNEVFFKPFKMVKKPHPVIVFLLGTLAGALLILGVYKLIPAENLQDGFLRNNIIIPSGFETQEEIIIPSGIEGGQNIIIPSGYQTQEQIIIPSGIMR